MGGERKVKKRKEKKSTLSGFQSCFATKNVCVLVWRQHEPFHGQSSSESGIWVLSQELVELGSFWGQRFQNFSIMVCYGLFLEIRREKGERKVKKRKEKYIERFLELLRN